ncbi:DOMON domain-containingprotein [Purpureocillium lilacinum]|uniref:DOMON domain-containingprotein n=1 Tax=Purpureocillium lilacinum TaxID=33203 RepID=A0A179HMP3_PURLI|nr:DOMON domain-containingprotein [Purpureocillium lilacinum]OAQ84146.1 DOMON domain-containingprotein [Purpureocillium lilacinum]OAQ90938.1 DOMON domain-containingprotein [Purpureocillium lilacinum]GJN77876.1 hypothetical protein PLIIFM63780_001369 [Purpureocillium lilacinum]
MRLASRTAWAAALALAVAGVHGEPTPYCPVEEVCFQFAVPEAAASSGSGNVYFQLKASSSVSWAGLGIGSQMSGATMFIMYANGKNNVTLSTRKGTGHVEPRYSRMTNVELLEGTGIINGSMIANVRCSGCANLDLSGVSSWVSAWKRGSAMNEESPSASIVYHDSHNNFNVNLGMATINSDANPFVNSSSTPGGNNGGGNGDGNSGGNKGGNGGGGVIVTGAGGGSSTTTLINAHGILMTVVFVVGYPIGAMLSPFVSTWIIHATWQSLVFFAMWAGFGLGIVICSRIGFFFQNTHTQLGVFIVSLMGLQPIFGFLHHRHYLRNRRRGIISYVHIWYGRSLMILGVVNGGLGLQLAGNPQPFVTVYIAVAAIVAAAYLAVSAFALFRKRKPAGIEPPANGSDNTERKKTKIWS